MRVQFVVAIDLDDTLYPEVEFVRSGFQSVARHVAQLSGEDCSALYQELLRSLEVDGRGRQFDALLATRRLAQVNVTDLVSHYRAHKPSLHLPETSRQALRDIRKSGHLVFVVTDGDPGVQRGKVGALGLSEMIDGAIYTWDEGPGAGKPSPRGFERLLEQVGLPASQLVYVADNPIKDFIAVRRAGGRSVRVLTGAFRKIVPSGPDFGPDFEVESLEDVEGLLRGALLDLSSRDR
jgi:putative hydrolase of the HAD superfamily